VPAAKVTTKKAPGKAAEPAPMTTAQKAAAKKAVEEGVPIEAAKKQAAKVPAARKARTPAKTPAAPQALVVRADEEPWTKQELGEVRAELQDEVRRLRDELDLAEHEIDDMLRDSGDGAGDDAADAGSKTFEREHEMSLANNTRDMLVQAERALGRIENGTYGICENCGNPIGKARLQVFPRATLCMTCKQREERR
jgi:RNA polymerase-binding protein DksA